MPIGTKEIEADALNALNVMNPVSPMIRASSLGSAAFKSDYGLRYAYVAGSMYKGVGSKELVIAWSVQNANRWADRGIRINVVSPGPVDTPIIGDFVKSFGTHAEDDIENAGGAGTAQDIAPAIVFLADDISSWINGQNIGTDGGLQAKMMSGGLGL